MRKELLEELLEELLHVVQHMVVMVYSTKKLQSAWFIEPVLSVGHFQPKWQEIHEIA